jgi:hypothetical protein
MGKKPFLYYCAMNPAWSSLGLNVGLCIERLVINCTALGLGLAGVIIQLSV